MKRDLGKNDDFRDAEKMRYEFLVPPFLALNVTRQKTDRFQQFHRFACLYLSAGHHHHAPTRSVTDIHSNPCGMNTKHAALS
jgi:hypothetical protein